MRMVDEEEGPVGRGIGRIAVGKRIVAPESPGNIGEGVAAVSPRMSEEDLGVEAVEKRRVDVVARFGAEEMFQSIHGCKDTK